MSCWALELPNAQLVMLPALLRNARAPSPRGMCATTLRHPNLSPPCQCSPPHLQIRASTRDRPRPLYYCTALNLGLHKARGQPCLLDYLLPQVRRLVYNIGTCEGLCVRYGCARTTSKQEPAYRKLSAYVKPLPPPTPTPLLLQGSPLPLRRWMRRLLLLPPGPATAAALHRVCEILAGGYRWCLWSCILEGTFTPVGAQLHHLRRCETPLLLIPPPASTRAGLSESLPVFPHVPAASVVLKLRNREANDIFFREMGELCAAVQVGAHGGAVRSHPGGQTSWAQTAEQPQLPLSRVRCTAPRRRPACRTCEWIRSRPWCCSAALCCPLSSAPPRLPACRTC